MIIAILLTGLIGLSIGSFLNVLIYRLPIMLQHEWQQISIKFDLFYPRSHCPTCKHTLTIRDLIPCLSYLNLRGKCRYCQHPIALRYPLIELATAIVSIFLIWHYNLSWQAVAAMIFSWYLLALFMIDIDQHLLPDMLTLSLLWVGLISNLFGLFTDINSAIIGAISGYLSLWLLNRCFSAITGKIGMGHGDFKLFAALGAWLGWQTLPFVILIAAMMGTLVGITLIMAKGYQRDTPIAFGPFLAIAGWIGLYVNCWSNGWNWQW